MSDATKVLATTESLNIREKEKKGKRDKGQERNFTETRLDLYAWCRAANTVASIEVRAQPAQHSDETAKTRHQPTIRGLKVKVAHT